MAKNSYNYDIGPWRFRKESLTPFVRVTEENRANAAISGRILYIIEGTLYRGHLILQPALKKGQNVIQRKPWEKNKPDFSTVFIPEDMNYNEHISILKHLVSKFISEGTLFINPTDPILKFTHKNAK